MPYRRPLQPDPTIAEDFMWSDNYDNLSEAMPSQGDARASRDD
jgi:hypothetical protein